MKVHYETGLNDEPVLKKFKDIEIVSGEFLELGDNNNRSWSVYETGILKSVTAGSIRLQIRQDITLLTPGMTIYLPPSTPHRLEEADQNVLGWRISIPWEKTSRLFKKVCIVKSSELMLQLCKRIASWGQITSSAKCEQRKRVVATFQDEIEAACPVEHFQVPLPISVHLRIAALKVLECPQDRRLVIDWAKFCGMSLSSFTKQFVEETGMSFATWRQKVRLQTAVKMLSENQSVSAVATQLGYLSSSTFVEAFRKHFGVPPKQYVLRQKIRSAPMMSTLSFILSSVAIPIYIEEPYLVFVF